MFELGFGLGLIEGFYGREWNPLDRIACLRYLAKLGYRYYVFAPKGDVRLRSRWQETWDDKRALEIREIASVCRDAGMQWGVGLSPLGLAEDWSAQSRQRLRNKIALLNGFAPQLLCILFDDMPRQVDDLAARQIEIVAEIQSCSTAAHLIVCPSYYSRDPILEKLFGPRPVAYWENLGRGLAADVGLFWTGDRVCSTDYEVGSLRDIAERFQRKPVLWDNYPVNDGLRMSNYLHLDAFRGRPPQLADLTQAHFANPMNQCWLSRIPLASLPLVYAQDAEYDADRVFRDCADAVAGEPLGRMIAEDLGHFQQQGRQELDVHLRQRLRARYAGFPSPLAREIVAWLDGDYVFDPACLTG